MMPARPCDACPADADRGAATIPASWTRDAWRLRLFQLAERCEALHPDRAAELRAWARRIST